MCLLYYVNANRPLISNQLWRSKKESFGSLCLFVYSNAAPKLLNSFFKYGINGPGHISCINFIEYVFTQSSYIILLFFSVNLQKRNREGFQMFHFLITQILSYSERSDDTLNANRLKPESNASHNINENNEPQEKSVLLLKGPARHLRSLCRVSMSGGWPKGLW